MPPQNPLQANLNSDVLGKVYEYLDIKDLAALQRTCKELSGDATVKGAKVGVLAKALEQRVKEARQVRDHLADAKSKGLVVPDDVKTKAGVAAKATQTTLSQLDKALKEASGLDASKTRQAVDAIRAHRKDLDDLQSEIDKLLPKLATLSQAAQFLQQKVRQGGGAPRTPGPLGPRGPAEKK